MVRYVGGTRPGATHDLAIPFESVRSLLDRYKARDPDKTALYDLDQETSITFGELHAEANRIANFLAERGIGKGDKVCVLSDERLEKIILWMGIWRAGAVICPLNVEMNIAYIAEIVQSLAPKLTLWHQDMDGPRMTRGVAGDIMVFSTWRPAAARKFATDDADAGELFARVAVYPAYPERGLENAPEDIGSIYCTSGTTDMPKLFVCDQLGHWLFGLSSIDFLDLTEDDRTLEYRSFGWNSAQGMSLMPWMQTGCTLYFARRFSHSRFFDWIKTHGITFSVGIPTVINMLLNEPVGVTAKDVPTLRLMSSSTAPLAPERWQQFEDMYGIPVIQCYGSSEGGWVCGNRHDYKKKGTVGPPAKHQEFLIIDGDGNPCPPGVEGEVTLGGPQCVVASISAGGEWEDLRSQRIHLGDLAVMDAEGFVTVTGRLKDLIIRGGVNISPSEIDNVVLRHPKVLEAAAVGVPDTIYGEEVVCYVVKRPGEALTDQEIKGHCAQTMPDYRIPKEVYFVDALPKNDRGKIRRNDLKEIWQREHPSA